MKTHKQKKKKKRAGQQAVKTPNLHDTKIKYKCLKVSEIMRMIQIYSSFWTLIADLWYGMYLYNVNFKIVKNMSLYIANKIKTN